MTMKRQLSRVLLALALLTSLLSPALAKDAGFTDVPASHWASAYIQKAYDAGWVHGMGGGKYEPSGALTRAQFLTMVTNAFFTQEVEQASAPDGSPWYAACWSVAQANGLHTGASFQSLGDLPKQISRYDMAQVIVNTLSGQGLSASADDAQSAQGEMQDWSSVPAGYRDAVSGAYALGILNGRNGSFDGEAAMNRAEAAAVLCRMGEAIASGGPIQTPSTAPQTPGTTAQTPSTAEELCAEVVRLVNVERAKEGLEPMKTYDSLTKAAQLRAPEIVEKFEHTRPDGTSYSTAIDEVGDKRVHSAGENIAAGNATAAATVEQWMNSPGHRANILRARACYIGVGYQYDPNSTYRHYWVQLFATVDEDTAGTSTQKPGTTTQTPSTAPQTPSTPASTPDELTAEVVRLVNVERAKEGLAPLGTYDSLTRAAQIRAPEIVTLFSHDRPDGTKCYTAMDETGARAGAYTYGENIAAGNATAAATVEQWMNSPGHRANILNKDFTHIGVGYQHDAGSTYGDYWVQMFVGTKTVPGGGSGQTPAPDTGKQPSGGSTGGNSSGGNSGGGTPAQTGGLLFSCPTITLYPGGTYRLSVLERDMRSASGVTWANESPDLLRLDGNGASVTALGSSGTGYLTASRNGETVRLTVRIIPTEDQIALSCLSTTMQVGGYGSTELYVFSTSRFYGQDCTVSWSVDDPSVLTLEERTSSKGNPSVRFQASRTGDACVTCRVTMADGSTAEEYCFAHVR